MKKIKKLLIANRGEIALRIIRSARELGIETVAVFSDIDRKSPFVRQADYALPLHGNNASDTYLNIDKIIECAHHTGVEAIHPGYGFLSENAEFAERVSREGLIFVGPSAESIRLMGDKISAKQAAADFNVPLIPGNGEPDIDEKRAVELAGEIGYPVMLKASAGGGGKGMRVARSREELMSLLPMAKSEAIEAFGNGAVFLEKCIESPKHIEIQILADGFGNIIYLNERECSIQRRHQKLIEEAPSPNVDKTMRKKMGEAATNIAKACNYCGAGTVEFIADEELNFYFLEMNTRLQVEHPVTEMTTGIDLVIEQIKIAEGHQLQIDQDDINIKGHAIELRVNAEDPFENFMPSAGSINYYQEPFGPGVRVDSGYDKNMEVTPYYDPMIAKLIVHAETRELAIEKMKRAIDEYLISGVATTLPFGKFVMDHPEFRNGRFSTGFVEAYWEPNKQDLMEDEGLEMIAAFIGAQLYEEATNKNINFDPKPEYSAWQNRKK